MKSLFGRFARWTAWVVGSPQTFGLLVITTLLWMVGGLVLGFSANYQLAYNSAVNALTLWLVALLQGSQNFDTRALHLKLDELIRAQDEARTGLVDLESLSQDEQERLAEQFSRLRERHQHQHDKGQRP